MPIPENIHRLLEEKLRKLNKFRPISFNLLAKLRERFEIEMTYNSNAIEGNSLTLKETFWVISEGITIKCKPLKDHLEAKNHKEALDFLYELIEYKDNQTISELLVKNIHSLVIQDIDKNISGKYREVDVFITGSEHKPPSHLDVPGLMHGLIKWASENINKMHIVEFSALFHHKFVNIHPFTDGNGR